jgi:sn-glycerol 3-phosphate transport system permease protein
MNQGLQGRAENVGARAIMVFAILFITFFVVREFNGLVRLADWLLRGIAGVPAALRNVFEYYAQLPASQLVPSLLVGAGVGAAATGLVFLATAGIVRLPRLDVRAALIGAGTLIISAALSLDPLIAAALALVSLLGAAYALQPTVRAALNSAVLSHILAPRGLRTLGLGVLIGALGGAAGSQLLATPLSHCTFAPEAPAAEHQLGLLLTGFGALVVLVPIWSVLVRRSRPRNLGMSGYFRGRALPFVFLAPTLLSLALFLYYPGVQTINLSLNLRRFPLPQERFVCLGNYINLAQDTIYRNSFVTTFVITAAIVLLSISVALGIGLLASQKVRGAGIYRTLLIWPFALSPVVTGTVFLAMFREGGSGLINYALSATIGIEPRWLRDPGLAQVVIILASVWNILGFNILFYITGLQNIPKDLLEAAQIDGANRVQRFWRITFPLLAPFTFFLLVTNVTYSFYGIYGAVDTLTQGGPPLGPAGSLGGATNVLIFKLYQDAFSPGSPAGLAAAQSLILFVLVAGITLIQFRYIERQITYGDRG